jgi:dihydroorotase
MNRILLRGGPVIDPASETDRATDVFVEDGLVARVAPGQRPASSDVRVVELHGKLLLPGFIDLHVHLREPGQEYKEDIASGTRAAVAGGFTAVCCMPNTVPPNDTRAVTELITRRAREVGVCHVLPVGAISKGLAGAELAEIGELRDAGCVAVSDDGRPVMSSGLMRRALEYAATFGLPVVQHAEDLGLSAGGVMNEGEVATRAGLRGQPASAESVMVARDLELVAHTGGRYHVAHLSTARSAALVRDARRRGLPVTCEVTPHHLTLTDAACAAYDTRAKCAPPLRTAADVAALEEALADGTIDAVATDHAPHSAVEKELEFDNAAFGMTGLETALPLLLRLVERKVIGLPRAVALLTASPARCFNLPAGRLGEGLPADLTVVDPGRRWRLESTRSKSRNTPFWGEELVGQAVLTLVAGRPVHDVDGVLS